MTEAQFEPTVAQPLQARPGTARRRGTRLGTLLLLFAALATLPWTVSELLRARQERQFERARTVQALEAETRLAAGALEAQLRTLDKMLVAAAQAAFVAYRDARACSAWMKPLPAQSVPGVRFAILQADGRRLCEATEYATRPMAASLVRQAQARPGELVLTVFPAGTLSDRTALVLARAVPATSQAGPAALVVTLDLDVVVPHRGPGEPSPAEALIVLDSDQRVVFSRPRLSDPPGQRLADPDWNAAVQAYRAGVPVPEPSPGGLLKALASADLGDGNRLLVLRSVPDGATRRPAGETLTATALTAAGALAMALLIWVAGLRLLAAPVRRLRRSLIQIERGEHAKALDATEPRIAELAGLQRSVNSLVLSLENQRFERDEALAALQERENRYRELFEGSPQIMYVFDRRTLRFLAVNQAAVRFYGYAEGEFLQRNLLDIRPASEHARLLSDLISGKPDPDSANWTHRLRSGELRQVEIATHPVDFNGQPAQLVMVTDITARLLAEERARLATERLEQRVAERTRDLELSNRELEAFAWSVSHDLRNPLRAVDMFRQMLQEQLPAPVTADPDVAQCLMRMEQGLGSMQELIDQIMALARVSRVTLQPEPIDLSALAAEVVDELRAAEPGRSPRILIEPGLACEGDRALVRQLLVNLLGNAWKFTLRKADAHIHFGTHAGTEPGLAEFFVADNGAGFDMKFAARLFEPFERFHAEDDFPGTGIGLATVQRVVARHGGRIWADAAVGEGATFTFTLPGVPTP